MDGHHTNDPYRSCESHCNHDLARGISIAELLGSDGPYPPSHLIVSLSHARTSLFDDEEREVLSPSYQAG